MGPLESWLVFGALIYAVGAFVWSRFDETANEKCRAHPSPKRSAQTPEDES